MIRNIMKTAPLLALAVLLMGASSGPYGQAVSNLEDNYIIAPGPGDDENPIEWLCRGVPDVHFAIIDKITNKTGQKGKTDENGRLHISRIPNGEYLLRINLKPEKPPERATLKDEIEFKSPLRLPMPKDRKIPGYSIFRLEPPAHVFTLIKTWHYKIVFYTDGKNGPIITVNKKCKLKDDSMVIAELKVPEKLKTTDLKCRVLRIY